MSEKKQMTMHAFLSPPPTSVASFSSDLTICPSTPRIKVKVEPKEDPVSSHGLAEAAEQVERKLTEVKLAPRKKPMAKCIRYAKAHSAGEVQISHMLTATFGPAITPVAAPKLESVQEERARADFLVKKEEGKSAKASFVERSNAKTRKKRALELKGNGTGIETKLLQHGLMVGGSPLAMALFDRDQIAELKCTLSVFLSTKPTYISPFYAIPERATVYGPSRAESLARTVRGDWKNGPVDPDEKMPQLQETPMFFSRLLAPIQGKLSGPEMHAYVNCVKSAIDNDTRIQRQKATIAAAESKTLPASSLLQDPQDQATKKSSESCEVSTYVDLTELKRVLEPELQCLMPPYMAPLEYDVNDPLFGPYRAAGFHLPERGLDAKDKKGPKAEGGGAQCLRSKRAKQPYCSLAEQQRDLIRFARVAYALWGIKELIMCGQGMFEKAHTAWKMIREDILRMRQRIHRQQILCLWALTLHEGIRQLGRCSFLPHVSKEDREETSKSETSNKKQKREQDAALRQDVKNGGGGCKGEAVKFAEACLGREVKAEDFSRDAGPNWAFMTQCFSETQKRMFEDLKVMLKNIKATETVHDTLAALDEYNSEIHTRADVGPLFHLLRLYTLHDRLLYEISDSWRPTMLSFETWSCAAFYFAKLRDSMFSGCAYCRTVDTGCQACFWFDTSTPAMRARARARARERHGQLGHVPTVLMISSSTGSKETDAETKGKRKRANKKEEERRREAEEDRIYVPFGCTYGRGSANFCKRMERFAERNLFHSLPRVMNYPRGQELFPPVPLLFEETRERGILMSDYAPVPIVRQISEKQIHRVFTIGRASDAEADSDAELLPARQVPPLASVAIKQQIQKTNRRAKPNKRGGSKSGIRRVRLPDPTTTHSRSRSRARTLPSAVDASSLASTPLIRPAAPSVQATAADVSMQAVLETQRILLQTPAQLCAIAQHVQRLWPSFTDLPWPKLAVSSSAPSGSLDTSNAPTFIEQDQIDPLAMLYL